MLKHSKILNHLSTDFFLSEIHQYSSLVMPLAPPDSHAVQYTVPVKLREKRINRGILASCGSEIEGLGERIDARGVMSDHL